MSSRAQVLVVDDEYALRRLLRTYLEKDGFAVLEAENGHDALRLIRAGNVDAALVDVMLPGLDGFELVRRIRQESTIPLILLTARGEETNRVAGLEVGADDYVVKPFSAPEVVARVRAQLRRAQGFESASPAPLRVGSLEVDPASRLVSVDGRDVSLTRREFDLLVALMSSPNRVYRREELLELVWGSEFLSAKTVDVHVAGLRRKLGSSVKITALRGVGYRFEA
jgi:two-component system response regulator ResD